MNCLWKLFGACKAQGSLTQLHCLLIKTGLIKDVNFVARLSDFYTTFELFENALKLVDEIPSRSVYIWNRILQRCCREKRYEEALSIFSYLFSCEKPDSFTVGSALKACSGLRAVNFGKTIHSLIKKHDILASNLFIGSGLIEFYSKCGKMGEALRVFEEYHNPDIVLWTALVSGYEQNGEPERSLTTFAELMMSDAVSPDNVALVSVVSACTQLFNMNAGRSIHGFAIRSCFDIYLPLLNAFLNLYAKTGYILAAENLFSVMEEKDVISWGSMISCYAHNGAANKALGLFNEMILRGVEPNSASFISSLQACEASGNLVEGRKIHELAVLKGFRLDILVSTALIDMYMNCCCPREAIMVFEEMPNRDAVSWFAVLHGCVKNGMTHKSMVIFHDMLARGIQPDANAMVKILTACSELGVLQQVCCLHSRVIRVGFDNNSFVRASLIECYAKCGSLVDAINVFEEIKDRDVVIWSSMLAAYGIHGQARESINLFSQMIRSSVSRPNNVTFLSILAACSHAGLVKEGIEFFNTMVHRYHLIPESKHYSVLVDLLGRTGELDQSISIINQMKNRIGADVWGALLGASSIHHNAEIGENAARNLFQLDPDNMGYHVLLSNIYAVDGKWDDASELRTSIKDRGLKKIPGESVVLLN